MPSVTSEPVPPPEAVTVTPDRGASVTESRTIPLIVALLAATYGPTNGPPSPEGAAPSGWIAVVDVSSRARARSRRPLPVSACVPAAAALRARRPTITPLDADGSNAATSAAAPATCAAAADVPDTDA